MITESSGRHSKSEGKAPLILNLSTRQRSVVNFLLWLLYPRERTPVPTEQETGWASEPVCPTWSIGTTTLTPLTWLLGRHSMSEKYGEIWRSSINGSLYYFEPEYTQTNWVQLDSLLHLTSNSENICYRWSSNSTS